MTQRTLSLLIIAVLLVGGGWIWLNRVPVTTRTVTPAIPLAGHPAPDFTLPTLNDQNLTLSDLRGQAIVLNFWASWCGPCRAEMPELQQAYDSKKENGLIVLGVNQGESETVASDFMSTYGLDFPVVLDTQLQVSRLYHTNSLPTTFFIDRNGVIREQVIGQMNTALLDERLRSIYP